MNDLYDTFPSNSPSEYIVNNKAIKCSHCNNELFIKSSALLNSAVMTFLGLDWANKSAITLICNKCGQVLWFLKPKNES